LQIESTSQALDKHDELCREFKTQKVLMAREKQLTFKNIRKQHPALFTVYAGILKPGHDSTQCTKLHAFSWCTCWCAAQLMFAPPAVRAGARLICTTCWCAGQLVCTSPAVRAGARLSLTHTRSTHRHAHSVSAELISWLTEYIFVNIPFSDFEALLEPVDEGDNRTHKHVPICCAWLLSTEVECENTEVSVYTGIDCVEIFIQNMIQLHATLKHYFYKEEPIIMRAEDVHDFNNANVCWICRKGFEVGDVKVRDHNHITGIIRYIILLFPFCLFAALVSSGRVSLCWVKAYSY
jgi:hypothetical protein